MEGQDFLTVAKNLAQSQFEAALRSAVSRAYYALFNASVQFLEQLGFTVLGGPGGHGQVRNRLSNSGEKEMIEFSRILDELRKRRNDADYNMQTKEFQKQMTCALRIAKAEMAIELLAKCNKEPLQSQIRKNIRDYDQRIAS